MIEWTTSAERKSNWMDDVTRLDSVRATKNSLLPAFGEDAPCLRILRVMQVSMDKRQYRNSMSWDKFEDNRWRFLRSYF